MTSPGYEDELPPKRGPVIQSLLQKMTTVKELHKIEYLHTCYPPQSHVGIIQPSQKNNLKNTQESVRRGKKRLPRPHKFPLKGRPRTFYFTNHRIIMEIFGPKHMVSCKNNDPEICKKKN